MNAQLTTLRLPTTTGREGDTTGGGLRPAGITPAAPDPPALLRLAVRALPVVTDDMAASIIEEMALTIVEQREELLSVRLILHSSLAHSHDQQREISRLQGRFRQLRAAQAASQTV